ncbi:MAG: hypothetical protein AAGF30_15635 [Pseudomonadota bacterium]
MRLPPSLHLAREAHSVTLERAAAPTGPSEAQIARINALTATGRTDWVSLAGCLAFGLVTALGAVDVDVFVDIRQTELPLVGISVFTLLTSRPVSGGPYDAPPPLGVRSASEV